MNPIVMACLIVGLTGLFLSAARKRWALFAVGDTTFESRTDRLAERLQRTWTFAFFQKKMRYYYWAGVAHQLIFMGFAVLLLRTLVLWGRGFVPDFNLFVLGPDGFLGLPLGEIYAFLKDVFALFVLAGALVFFYYRLIKPQSRMALGIEGLLILTIMSTMMLSDILYDAASIVLNHRVADICAAGDEWCDATRMLVAPLAPAHGPVVYHPYPDLAGGLVAQGLTGLGSGALVVLAHAGYWTHVTLVLVFLNLLPHSKHFHVITAIPNVFLSDLDHPGRLRPVAKNTEALMGLVEQASEQEDMNAARIGYARIEHFTWKDVLDFYTCTECGRCSDNCPAFTTGKKLSPKQLTLDLRNHLYGREKEVIELTEPIAHWRPKGEDVQTEGGTKPPSSSPLAEKSGGAEPKRFEPKNLLPEIIDPDVIWACTTCRACEEQCPVMITYVDKIVQLRRHEVMIKGDGFPSELSKPFEGMEVNGNPWNLSRMDRANWAEGLGVPLASDKPDAQVLFWVGCAASYDDRAKNVARSTARLLQAAGVEFAILGQEETCTGDPARTLLNEYPDFGGKYDVVHHSDYLLGLLAQGKLSPKLPVKAKVTYHDSCYLGRYNEVYEQPREILRRIPGVELVEPETHHHKGLCCGAGGAQMWMEEQNKDRVNVKRTKQLLSTGSNVISSACPFCMTMLTDGLKSEEKEATVRQLDIVELLAESCLEPKAVPAAAE